MLSSKKIIQTTRKNSPTSPSQIHGILAIRIFLIFASGYFLSYALRTVNAALAPMLAADLHLSAGALGWLTSAYFLAFAAMQIPVGIWLDRYGARRTEAALLVVAAIGASLVATGESLWSISLGRILIGMGVAPCLMAPYAYFRRCFAPAQQPRLVMGMLLIGAAGALIATQPALTFANAVGWRQLFFIACGLLLLSALGIFFLTTDADRQAHSTTGQSAEKTDFLTLSRHPVMLRCIPVCIFTIGGFAALQTLWAGPWLTSVLGMHPEQASMVLLYLNAGLMVSYLVMSTVSPWLLRSGLSLFRQSMIALVWLPTVFALMVCWQGPLSWICWLLLVPVIPAMYLLQTQTALDFPGHVAGRILTTFNLMTFAGTFLVQWGIGLAVDAFISRGHSQATSLRLAFACLVALQAVSLVWFVICHKKKTSVASSQP